MRADRLLSILMLLQTKGRMTAHDLADQLEVSERTIYRDLEALSMAGIPVYTERGPGGGCSLVDGYQTRLTGLNEAEIRALFLLNIAGPLADLGLARALDDAMLKLTAALPATSREYAELVRQRFHLDTTWWYHTDDATPWLQTIQEALWQDQKLRLFYHEDDGVWSERLIDPYGLVSKARVWYLIAGCYDEKCVFRVSRIHNATITEEQFVRQEDFDLAAYWTDYCAQVEINRPSYSLPLRLAPEEAQRLPQLLQDCGYMLVENEEPCDVSKQENPLLSQKKQILHCV
jgi:predicted DNA-binding transcriptional regulator YafY